LTPEGFSQRAAARGTLYVAAGLEDEALRLGLDRGPGWERLLAAGDGATGRGASAVVARGASPAWRLKRMRRGGLTAANCTCSVWENFESTMRNIAGWNRHFADNADLIMPVRTTADIRRAKKLGRTGIILGFQNVSAFEDQLGYVRLFKNAGVGIAQMAYNTQNLYATGCYESVDRGLSDFGQELVAEMNRVGGITPPAAPAAVPPPPPPPGGRKSGAGPTGTPDAPHMATLKDPKSGVERQVMTNDPMYKKYKDAGAVDVTPAK